MSNSTPRLQRGAIIGLDPKNPAASVVVFQYNPHQLTRSLSAKSAMEGGRGEALSLGGAPTETISLEVEIDAADQLGENEEITESLGIYPQLSALEMLLYPKSAEVLVNTALLAMGSRELMPPSAPLTLFVWGTKRVVPVRITNFSISEQGHDLQLNPIRASVSLSLQVLSYNDLLPSHLGYQLFMGYQVAKETMASLNTVNGLSTTFTEDFKQFF